MAWGGGVALLPHLLLRLPITEAGKKKRNKGWCVRASQEPPFRRERGRGEPTKISAATTGLAERLCGPLTHTSVAAKKGPRSFFFSPSLRQALVGVKALDINGRGESHQLESKPPDIANSAKPQVSLCPFAPHTQDHITPSWEKTPPSTLHGEMMFVVLLLLRLFVPSSIPPPLSHLPTPSRYSPSSYA